MKLVNRRQYRDELTPSVALFQRTWCVTTRPRERLFSCRRNEAEAMGKSRPVTVTVTVTCFSFIRIIGRDLAVIDYRDLYDLWFPQLLGLFSDFDHSWTLALDYGLVIGHHPAHRHRSWYWFYSRHQHHSRQESSQHTHPRTCLHIHTTHVHTHRQHAHSLPGNNGLWSFVTEVPLLCFRKYVYF